MELTGELKEAFNAQVTMELKAAVVYRQLSIDMDALDLPGIAGWFKAQSAEEEVHADKFITHMLDRDATPLLRRPSRPRPSTSPRSSRPSKPPSPREEGVRGHP